MAIAPASATPRRLHVAHRAHSRDVASFHVLPLSGPPSVSVAQDPVMGALGPGPYLLSQLEKLGRVGATAAGGFRLLTRAVGPVAYLASAGMEIALYRRVAKDPAIAPSSKVALGVGTATTTVGAVSAGVAALPSRWAAALGLGSGALLQANRISRLAGGSANVVFAAINLRETLRAKGARPAERFFAKLGFGIGVAAFAASAVALVGSMPFAAGAFAALVPAAAATATILGFSTSLVWGGQLLLGKNAWLNRQLSP